MLTTLDIDDALLRDVRAICERESRPIGAVVTDLLADALSLRRTPQSRQEFRWLSRPINALVDLADNDVVYRAMGSERR